MISLFHLINKMKKRNMSNKLFYTLIVFGAIILMGAGVFALTAGTAPSPGHTMTSVSAPSGCATNTYLKWTGSAWTCATPTSSGGGIVEQGHFGS
jgi:hypothetical protein